MSATVYELLDTGRTGASPGVCTHRVWMEPGKPLLVGYLIVAEVRLCQAGERGLVRLLIRGRRWLPMVGFVPRMGRQCVRLHRNVWTAAGYYDLAMRPIAQNTRKGQMQSILVEFAALTAEAARGWPA